MMRESRHIIVRAERGDQSPLNDEQYLLPLFGLLLDNGANLQHRKHYGF